MPDISMCNGGGCQQKDRCYRFTATPNGSRQSFFSEPPMETPTKCGYFMEAWSKSQKRRLDVQTMPQPPKDAT